MRWIAIAFGLLLVGIVVLADRGELPSWLEFYRRLPFGDALGHFILMGLLALLTNLALSCAAMKVLGWRVLKGSFWVAVIVLVEELSQMLIPTRTFSLMDLGADLLGIVVLGGLAPFVRFRQRNRSTSVDPS